MASTAIRFPADNESQLPFWPDNEELPMPDNFFDQYVTFDPGDAAALGGDVLEDPPSPSILLESLHAEVAHSPSDILDLPSHGSHVETSARQPIPVALQTSSADQFIPESALLAALAGEPVLNNGSISDSELLHLEGISLQSSPHRRNATAPSSPKFATLTPRSPQKRNRLVNSVNSAYATVRRVANRLRPPRQEQQPQPVDMTELDAFLNDPRSALELFDNVNFDRLTDPTVAIKHEPIDCHGLPLSPPLTGRIPNRSQAGSSGFVSGNLDDPFGDEVLGSPAVIQPSRRQSINTPITPAINGETFFHSQPMTSAHGNTNGFRRAHKTYRSTSSAEWPTEGLLTDVKYAEDVDMWSSTSPSTAYITDNGNGNIQGQNWWETPEISHAEPAHHHATNGRGGAHDNATHNISMHTQQAELPYEYNNDLLSGLMIHMPQPRTPQASVLSSNINEHLLATSTPSSSSYHMQGTPNMSRSQTHHFPPQHSSHKGHGHTDRWQRPRAPSSGARHHGAQTSPRKLHHSMSLGYLREESQSPSPMSNRHHHAQHHNGHQNHHQERRQQRSSSLAVRKQRSFSRRGGNNESRTPSSTCATFATTPSSGGVDLSFVNFTPNDKNVLMTGVAPSGSSKTKARREKEALEKAARLGEAALKVAGGDVNPGLLKELMRDFSMADV